MLGMLSYCNALPLYASLKETLPFCFDTPNNLYQRLKKNEISCALTSSLHLLDEALTSFSPFCIAARNKVMSVTLYHKVPLSKIKEIAISSETTTSFALLRILSQFHWKISPLFVPLSTLNAEAFLLIGDQALASQTIEGYHSIDLATAWYEMTGLPFVFALFFTHKESPPPPIIPLLQQALDHALADKEPLITRVSKQKKLSPLLIKEYYNCLSYRLDKESDRGLEQFLTLYSLLDSKKALKNQ